MSITITLDQYREMIQGLTDEHVGEPREAAYRIVSRLYGREAAEQVDRRWYREVYLTD